MCQHCEGDKWLYEGEVTIGVLNDGRLEIHTGSGTSYVNIQCCPKCGRSLTAEEIDLDDKFSDYEKKIIKEQSTKYKNGGSKMNIQDVLKEKFLGEKFKDNNKRVWGVVRQGGCTDKQSLILIEDSKSKDFVGKQIEELFFLSDIVNLEFLKI